MARTVALLFLAVMLAACGGPGSGRTDVGKGDGVVAVADGDLYSVPAFAMTARKPQGWSAMSDAEAARILDAGAEIAAGDDRALGAAIEAGAKKSRTLFGFFEMEIGAPVPLNPNVMAIAEHLGATPGVRTGKDYFFHAKRLMNETGVNYQFKDDVASRRIGGIPFDRLDAVADIAGVKVNQSYYAAARDGYMLIFIETYGGPEDQAKTGAVLDSVTFKR